MAAAQPAPEDAKAYYGYLIEGDDKNKRASPVLEALLRAIAQHIVRCFSSQADSPHDLHLLLH